MGRVRSRMVGVGGFLSGTEWEFIKTLNDQVC